MDKEYWKLKKREQRAKEKQADEVTPEQLDNDNLEVRDAVKYPNEKAWQIAVERTIRARRYAAKFPHFIRGDDWVFQCLAWQYQHEGLPTVERSRSSSRLVLA